jgi:hypothetical protein
MFNIKHMKTITAAVRNLIKKDETALEAGHRGILNSSAYAREITSKIEEETWKNVEETTVTVAINRVLKEDVGRQIKPKLKFDKVSVETGLVDVTFEKTLQIKNQLTTLLPPIREKYPHDMFIETNSQYQITMIMSQKMWNELKNKMPFDPIGLYQNQVAISIIFDKRYLKIPNFIYAILGVFALQNINLTELFSTMTEIIVVVHTSDLDIALSGIKPYMR